MRQGSLSNFARLARVSGQVGVRQHHVAEPVTNEGVEFGYVATEINRPVLAQFFGA